MQEQINSGTEVVLSVIERDDNQADIRSENDEASSQTDSNLINDYREIVKRFHVHDDPDDIDEDDMDDYYSDLIDIVSFGLDEASENGQVPEPLYTENDSSKHGFNVTMNGAFLFNKLGRIRSHLRNSAKMPVLVQSYLQRLCMSNPDVPVTIMDLESLLFPQIFPFIENESSIGALPISMFMHPLVKRNEGLANLLHHLRVRTMDQTKLTSQECDYTNFVFNIVVNSLVSTKFIHHAIRKGIEFLKRPSEGIRSHITESSMLFDTVENRTPAVELGALAAENTPKVFFTSTCNQDLTPGVSKLCQHLKQFTEEKLKKEKAADQYDKDYGDATKLQIYNSHLNLIIRTWDRTIRWYMRLLTHGENPPFGKIKAYWLR